MKEQKNAIIKSTMLGVVNFLTSRDNSFQVIHKRIDRVELSISQLISRVDRLENVEENKQANSR